MNCLVTAAFTFNVRRMIAFSGSRRGSEMLSKILSGMFWQTRSVRVCQKARAAKGWWFRVIRNCAARYFITLEIGRCFGRCISACARSSGVGDNADGCGSRITLVGILPNPATTRYNPLHRECVAELGTTPTGAADLCSAVGILPNPATLLPARGRRKSCRRRG